MTPTRKRRLIAITLILAGIGLASGIAFWSLQQNLLYFQSPSEVAELGMPPGGNFAWEAWLRVVAPRETLAVYL